MKEETAVYTNIVCPYWDVMIAVLRKEEDLIAIIWICGPGVSGEQGGAKAGACLR